MKYIFFLLSILLSINLNAQKKVLDHPDFDIWNSIQRSNISADGDFIIYSLVRGEKDSKLKIKNNQGDLIFEYDRSCLLYTSPSPRDKRQSRMPSSA